MTSQLRRIRKLVRPKPVKPIAGGAYATITLANGRKARVRLSPRFAPAKAVDGLRRQFVLKDKRQSQAIRKLAATIKKLSAQQVKVSKDFAGQVARSRTQIEKALTKKFSLQRSAQTGQRRRLLREQRLQDRRVLCNGLVLAIAAPLFAVYWDRRKLASVNNALLVGGTTLSLLTDDLLRLLAGRGKKGRGVRKAAQLVSDLSPVLEAGTGALLMGLGQSTERFVTGTANLTVPADGTSTNHTGSATVTGRSGAVSGSVPVVATVIAGPAGLEGELTATVVTPETGDWSIDFVFASAEQTTGTITVSYMVDTQVE